jgi:hypothetical protein
MLETRLYTFGSPQVFQLRELQEPQWVSSVHEQENAFHFVNHMDWVPLVNLLPQRRSIEVISKSFAPATKKFFSCGLKSAVKVIDDEANKVLFKDCEWKQWGEIYYFMKKDGWRKINYSTLKVMAKLSSLPILQGIMVYRHMPWEYRANILKYVFEI